MKGLPLSTVLLITICALTKGDPAIGCTAAISVQNIGESNIEFRARLIWDQAKFERYQAASPAQRIAIDQEGYWSDSPSIFIARVTGYTSLVEPRRSFLMRREKNRRGQDILVVGRRRLPDRNIVRISPLTWIKGGVQKLEKWYILDFSEVDFTPSCGLLSWTPRKTLAFDGWI